MRWKAKRKRYRKDFSLFPIICDCCEYKIWLEIYYIPLDKDGYSYYGTDYCKICFKKRQVLDEAKNQNKKSSDSSGDIEGI
tara:strand:- start:8976 stop:9218 length:243 start_codon:yes stop_codon:yes gene_type:complete